MRPDEEIIELYQYFLLKKWNCIIICDEIKCTKRNIWIYFHISFPGVVSIKKIKYTKQLSQICLHFFFIYVFFKNMMCTRFFKNNERPEAKSVKSYSAPIIYSFNIRRFSNFPMIRKCLFFNKLCSFFARDHTLIKK